MVEKFFSNIILINAMFNSTQLQRLDRRSIENKAVIFSISVWLIVWLVVGIFAKAVWNDWYGFGAGFILGPVVSTFIIWMFLPDQKPEKKR
jgi:hypothetical protein